MISNKKYTADFNLAVKAEQYQDNIYKSIFPDCTIQRYKKGDDRHQLDIEHHIDAQITLSNKSRITIQEKALRHQFIKYNTFTIEFYQSRYDKEPGEFFNIASQYYLHGYWNSTETGLEKWYLLKIFDLLNYLKSKPLAELERKVRPTYNSRASFYAINYNDIPREFIHSFYDQERKDV